MTRIGMRGGMPELYPERNAEVIALLDEGLSFLQVARQLGLTRNVVAGIKNRSGRCVPTPTTRERLAAQIASTIARLDDLHARMDAVIAETKGVGRLRTDPKPITPFPPRNPPRWVG